MSANDLLLWMSAKEKGSWQQFRSAVEQLHISDVEEDSDAEIDFASNDLPIYQAVRFGLERLAHVEFLGTAGDNAWRVVPPSLAVINHGHKWIGIVCGARSPRLLARFPGVQTAIYEVTAQPYMPDRIRLIALTFNDLKNTAETLGLLVQKDAPMAILTIIPPVDDVGHRIATTIPPGTGWTVQRFVPNKLRWEVVEFGDFSNGGTNLFRFTLEFQRYYFLVERGQIFRINVQVGKYFVLRKRHSLLRYRASQEQLLFPRICAPPSLIERALVLCSGTLPVLDPGTGDIVYGEVPKNIANFVAQLLKQEVAII